MKTFTTLNEQCATSDVNPGNLGSLGVTNHLTPVQNILTNVRNFFATQLGVVASIGEDGVSIKLNSSKFVNKEEIEKVLNNPIQKTMSIKQYIQSQGLDLIKMIALGQYWVIYFSPSDVKTAMPGMEAVPATAPVKEQLEMNIDEAEFTTYKMFFEDEDEEVTNPNKDELSEILSLSDKVKAAKKLEALVAKEIELPREYYFAAVKTAKGKEVIALRWKYTKRTGKKETSELKKSLMHIYDDGEIFCGDLDKNSMFKLPTETNTLINNVLDMFDAEKTNDSAIFKIKDFEKKDSSKDGQNDGNKEKSEKKEDEKKDDNKKSEDTGGLL